MKNIITLPGVKNARELGGYGAGGSTVRTGALIRSGALDRAAPEAADILRDKYRLQAVVDFRMQVKRAAAPDVEIDGARNIGAPVIEMEDYAAMAGSPDMLKLYKANAADKRAVFEMAYEYGMLGPQIYLSFLFGERGKRAYREFFRVLLDSDPDKGAVLWHCDDGKDRAGLAAALLLSALGADRATIMEDYLLTNELNAPVLEAIRREYAPYKMPPEKLDAMLFASGGVFDYYLDGAFAALDTKCGGAEGYLRGALGLADGDFALLREKYLV